MEQVKEVALKKAIVLLNAIGAKYAIIDADGNQHGKLELASSRKRKKSIYNRGELTKYCVNNFKELSVGEVLLFPVGPYSITDMQRNLSSWLCKIYGNGTHATSINRDKNLIEILRVA